MSRRGITLIEALIAALVFTLLLVALWPLATSLLRAEGQLAALTGPGALLAGFRERLAWDLALASPPDLGGGAGALPDGSGVDVLVSDPRAGLRRIRWRFDASRKVITRDGQVVPLDGLQRASFRPLADHPEALAVDLQGAGPRHAPARLVLRWRPAGMGLAGWQPLAAAR